MQEALEDYVTLGDSTFVEHVSPADSEAAYPEFYRFAALEHGRPVKRAMDLALTISGGLLAAPIIALIVILIRLTSRGPVLFKHERIGRGGRRFKAYKFRTMVVGSDRILEAHLQANPAAREEWRRDQKLKNDPRVTWIGRFLRRVSFDELPQIWNVLRGEMSLVGPRPIVRAEIPKYGEQFDIYIRAVPGITGLWQVSGRNDTGYRQRVALDVEYVSTWNVWLDLRILFRTVFVVVGQKGAY
jgi:Undecaprenyl-phosphate galactose phosphotransferase WbaP